MAVYVGLDIGGTKFMVAAADAQGNVLRTVREDTPLALEAGLALLDAMVEEVAAGDSICAIGAAIGGPLDWRSGIVSPLHQPAWRSVPLKARMEQTWGCPFFVDVDTNIAALGEYHLTGETADRFLYVTVSTGVGGGFLLDGTVYRGTGGEHPEIGHQSVPYQCAHPERIRCECGAPDCLEALVSGNGIQRIYGKAAEHLDDEEWAEVAHNLGQGLRNLAAIYLPGVIVVGGGVALGGGDLLLQRLRRVLAEHLCIVPIPEVRLSRLGMETALRGALVVAMRGEQLLATSPAA